MPRVLVLDSDLRFRDLHRCVLEDLGFDVRTASEGDGALRLVRTWKPDLVVLDARLGHESGLDVLRRMLDDRPQLRAVIVSAHTGYRDDFASWLAEAFLVKSADCADLRRTALEIRESLASLVLA